MERDRHAERLQPLDDVAPGGCSSAGVPDSRTSVTNAIEQRARFVEPDRVSRRRFERCRETLNTSGLLSLPGHR